MNLLKILSSQQYISGQEVSRRLGISRAAVHKRIQKLRKQGYKINGQKNLGYTLVGCPDLVIPDEIKKNLPSKNPLGSKIIYYSETDSTQVSAKSLANKGACEGTLVVSEKQSAGYGRLRRQWLSPKGGIWFSLVLRPPILPDSVPQITLAVCISICKTLERCFNIKPLIKWPNDIVLQNKKLAGILTEMSAEVGRTNWVVVGVGLNANNIISGAIKKTAISLSYALGRSINRSKLIADVLVDFSSVYSGLCKKGFGAYHNEYNKRSMLKGKTVKVDTGSQMITGKVDKIDTNGYLWLNKSCGTTERIIAGDVKF